MASGGGVEDDDVVLVGSHVLHELVKSSGFVNTGGHAGHVHLVLHHTHIHTRVKSLLFIHLSLVVLHSHFRVYFGSKKVFSNGSRVVADVSFKRVRKGVSRVSGYDEGFFTFVSQP